MSNSTKNIFKKAEETREFCKHLTYKPYKAKQMKSSVFSIITGVALIGLGFVLEPVSGGASLVGNAFHEEIKEACSPAKPIEKPPQQFDSSFQPAPTSGVSI